MDATKCPECRYVLVRERGDHTAYMGRMVVKSDGTKDVVCPGCKSQVPMPLEMQKQLAKAFVIKTGA